jgi:RNA polymerase-associated protein RTF1
LKEEVVEEEEEQEYERGYGDETTWEDLKSAIAAVQLTRTQLEEWVDQPFFDDSVVGGFVRINIGKSKSTEENSYRLCEVVGIKNEDTSVAYKLMNGSYTRKKLIVGLGSARKSWVISQVSNSEVQPPELEGWKKWCEKVAPSP